MNTQALRIPFDPYDGYTPYPECQFDPIYAGPSVSHHIGFHIPDNRYVLEIPERLDTDALYSDHWQRFLDWAGDRGLTALPASPVVVAVYLTTLAETTNVLDALTAAEAIYSVHRWAAIPSPFDAPIYAGPSVSHHIGFHIPDNRYVLEIPERLDTDALYSDHWQRFDRAGSKRAIDWAGDRGLTALPASPVVVAVYLTTLAETTNVLDALTAAPTEAIYSVHRWAAIPSPFDAPILQLTTKRILWGYPPGSPYAPPTIDLNRDTIC